VNKAFPLELDPGHVSIRDCDMRDEMEREAVQKRPSAENVVGELWCASVKTDVPFSTALNAKCSVDSKIACVPSLQSIRPESVIVPVIWNPSSVSTLWKSKTFVPASGRGCSVPRYPWGTESRVGAKDAQSASRSVAAERSLGAISAIERTLRYIPA
jgi:hypothetical protein